MTERWTRRPALAWLARTHAVLLPAIAAVAAVLATDALLSGALAAPVRLLVLVLVAAVTAAAVASVSRRLLPLAFLLDLDLLLPAAMPSRFRLALRRGSTRALAELDDAPVARTIATMAAAIAQHDRHTRGHSERVRAYAEIIAEELGMATADRDRFRWAALLHDVGKLEVPADVIAKPAALDEHEWELVRRHPEAGARLIAPLAGWLGPFADTILDHHERWDGNGYPRGIAGDTICLGARIVAVADAYEVMTSSGRVYRPTLTPAEAREELVLTAGSHFDPAVVRAFLAVPLDELRRIAGIGGWLAGAGAALRVARPLPGVGDGVDAAALDPVVRFGPPAGSRLPDGAAASGRSSVEPDDVDVDDAAAAQDR